MSSRLSANSRTGIFPYAGSGKATQPELIGPISSANFSGQTGEDAAATWMRTIGIRFRRKPRVGVLDGAEREVNPDLAIDLGLASNLTADERHFFPFDTYIEMKRQHSGGSAIDKIPYTIERYGDLSDRTGKVCMLFHDFHRKGVKEAVIRDHERRAEAHGIGYVPVGSVTAEALRHLGHTLAARRAEVLRLILSGELSGPPGLWPTDVAATFFRMHLRNDPRLVSPDQLALPL